MEYLSMMAKFMLGCIVIKTHIAFNIVDISIYISDYYADICSEFITNIITN